jgi:hypothetical protein
MPSCRTVSRLVSDALDRRLPWRTRLLLRLHFFICTSCARFRKQLLFLREVIDRYLDAERRGRPVFPAVLSLEARTRIRRALERGSS